jgi:tRNA A37 threonylcarbamoyladenosine synthetase subunit TsaC/SUA5/YrdC
MGDDRKEMRDIRDALSTGELSKVPDYLRAMKRLWPGSLSVILGRSTWRRWA